MFSKYKNTITHTGILLIALIGILLFCSRTSKITQNTAISIYGVDLIAFHTAARLASQGETSDIYVASGNDFGGVDDGKFSRTARSSGFAFQPTRYVYLPVFLTPFQVLGRYNFHDAARVMLALNMVILLSIIIIQWNLIRDLFPPMVGLGLVTGINLLSYPVFYALKLGQTTLVIYLCICLIYYFSLKRRDVWAGVLLGGIITLKYTPLIFVLYFLYKKKFKLLAACFGTVAGLVLLSITIYGLPLHKSYWVLIKEVSSSGIAGWSNQSVLALLLRQLGESSALSYELISVSGGLFLLNVIGITLILLGVCYTLWKNRGAASKENFALEYSAVTLCFLILPSVSWLHYYCIAILPLLILFRNCLNAENSLNKKTILFLVLTSSCLVIFYPNIHRIIFILDKETVTRLAISFPLIGAGMLLVFNCFMLGANRFSKKQLCLETVNPAQAKPLEKV